MALKMTFDQQSTVQTNQSRTGSLFQGKFHFVESLSLQERNIKPWDHDPQFRQGGPGATCLASGEEKKDSQKKG